MRKLELQKNFMCEIEVRVNDVTVARISNDILTLFKTGIFEVGIFYFDGFTINSFGGMDKNIKGLSEDEIVRLLKVVFQAE